MSGLVLLESVALRGFDLKICLDATWTRGAVLTATIVDAETAVCGS